MEEKNRGGVSKVGFDWSNLLALRRVMLNIRTTKSQKLPRSSRWMRFSVNPHLMLHFSPANPEETNLMQHKKWSTQMRYISKHIIIMCGNDSICCIALRIWFAVTYRNKLLHWVHRFTSFPHIWNCSTFLTSAHKTNTPPRLYLLLKQNQHPKLLHSHFDWHITGYCSHSLL